jgi:hypothetical protein
MDPIYTPALENVRLKMIIVTNYCTGIFFRKGRKDRRKETQKRTKYDRRIYENEETEKKGGRKQERQINRNEGEEGKTEGSKKELLIRKLVRYAKLITKVTTRKDIF